jgi:hypothetical protein
MNTDSAMPPTPDQERVSFLLSQLDIAIENFNPPEDVGRASRYNDTPHRFRITSPSASDIYTARVGKDSQEHFDDISAELESLKCLRRAARGLVPGVHGYHSEQGYWPNRPYVICRFKRLKLLSPTSARTLGERLAKEVHVKTSISGDFGFNIPVYYRGIKIINGGYHSSWKECYEDLITGALSHLKSDKYSELRGKVVEVK